MPSLKDLLNSPWQDIAKLSDKQLEEICKPFFHITRPSEIAKRKKVENELQALAGKAATSRGTTSSSKYNGMQPDKLKAMKADIRKLAEEKMKQLGLPI